MSDLDDQINTVMFEWTRTVQALVRRGWTFGEIETPSEAEALLEQERSEQ